MTRPLETFAEGSRVVLVGLEHVYRDIEIVRVNHGGVQIRGSHCDQGVWKPLSDSFVVSCMTPAAAREPAKEPAKIEAVEEVTHSEPTTTESAPTGKKRGRQAKVYPPLKYPPRDFDMGGLAAFNAIPYSQCLQRAKKEGKLKFLREDKSGRGKARKVYVVESVPTQT